MLSPSGKCISYHRCTSDNLKNGDDIDQQFHKLDSPHPDVGLFRISGVFPTFCKDGSRLAFVDNDFKVVWVADNQGMRIVYETKGPDYIFGPVWNQNQEKDVLYVCMGPSFSISRKLYICAISEVSRGKQHRKQLTKIDNNAFPSTNLDGTKLVFQSERDEGDNRYKNLYITEEAESGEFGEGSITRLTNRPWTDTQCHCSPRGDWIVFLSMRDKPKDAPDSGNNLDPGFFVVFLVKANDPSVVERVLRSGNDLAGHVNHPLFSPEGKNIIMTVDLAVVSVDPISFPLFLHFVRPYGDIFTIDIDGDDIYKNMNGKKFIRVTHSRYENSPPSWIIFSKECLLSKYTS